MLDIFNDQAFSVTTLTAAVNKIPFVPGRIGQLGIFQEEGIPTTSITIEENNGILTLVPATPRGAPGTQAETGKRALRSLMVPHIELDRSLNADSVQGVRAFGTDNELAGFQQTVDMKQLEMSNSIDATIEYHRLGAVKGIVMDADGVTPLYNLFDTFNVSQEAEIDFDLDNANPTAGILRKKCDGLVRVMTNNLKGTASFRTVNAVVGDAFWDDLIAHPEVRQTYLNQQEAAQLRNGTVYQQFNFGGIVWENYRGNIGAVSFVDANKAHFFPVGAPGLFIHRNAPADYIETVNTIGLPRYSRMYPSPNGKAINLEVQANPICLCTQPKVLLKGKRT